MQKYHHTRSSILLLEIMINILFFSFLVIFCLYVFQRTKNTNLETKELNEAVICVSNIAEFFYGSDGDSAFLYENYPDATYTGATMTIYYDEDFDTVTASEAYYEADINFTTDESLSSADIAFHALNSDTNIYTLSLTVHLPFTIETSFTQEETGGTVE